MQRDQLHPCLSTIFSKPFEITPEGVDEALGAWAAAGSEGLSFWSLHHMVLGGDSAAIAAQIKAHGLDVAAIEAIYGWANADSPDAAVADADLSIQLCVDYGASTLVAVVLEPELVDATATAANLAAVSAKAAEANVEIAIEFLPWSGIPDITTCWDIVQQSEASNAGILLDSWHWHHQPGGSTGKHAETLASIPGDAIKIFQICDAESDPTDDPMGACMSRRPLPGDGVVDHAGLFELLREIDADPIVSPEVFNAELIATGMTETASQINAASKAMMATWT